jgi:hypothetical protein
MIEMHGMKKRKKASKAVKQAFTESSEGEKVMKEEASGTNEKSLQGGGICSLHLSFFIISDTVSSTDLDHCYRDDFFESH